MGVSEPFFHVHGSRRVKTVMGLTARLDESPAPEIVDIVLQGETNAEGDPGGAGGPCMSLDGFDQAAGDAPGSTASRSR